MFIYYYTLLVIIITIGGGFMSQMMLFLTPEMEKTVQKIKQDFELKSKQDAIEAALKAYKQK